MHNGRLSPELIAIIAEQLNSEDFFSFRLVARYLRDCSYAPFINRFFRQRVHLLSRHSLSALLEISLHPLFAPSTQTVVISPDHLIPDHLRDHAHSLPAWVEDCRSSGVVQSGPYQDHLREQSYIQWAGLDTGFLTRIFGNLRNCRAISLDDRYRPWGAAAIKREVGLYPSSNADSEYSKSYFQGVVQAIIAAMTASEAPITTLAMDNGIERIHVHPRILRPPASYLDGVQWVATLTCLRLTLDPGYDDDPVTWSRPLADFVRRFPHLKCLDLYFDTRVEQLSFNALAKTLKIPQLRTLKLAGVDCLPEDLFTIFDNHRNTLRIISLDIIGLSTRTGGSWQTLLEKIRDELRITRLQMSQCDLDGDDICFDGGDGDRSNTVDVIGEDPALLDRLIRGLSRGTPAPEERDWVIEIA